MDGMLSHVERLKRRIEESLDKDYNITDLPAIVDCISQLENLTISKEILLSTRVGKLVNDLRRKVPDSQAKFAKRLKALVKNWSGSCQDNQAAEVVLPQKPSSEALPVLTNGKSSSRIEELQRSSPRLRPVSSSPAIVNGSRASPSIYVLSSSITSSGGPEPRGSTSSKRGYPTEEEPAVVSKAGGPGRITLKFSMPATNAKKQKLTEDSRSNSPHSTTSREPNDSKSPSFGNPATPDSGGVSRVVKPVKRPEKVKSQQEIVAQFRKEYPSSFDGIPDTSSRGISSAIVCDESSLSPSASSPVITDAKNDKKNKLKRHSSAGGDDNDKARHSHRPGRGPDPMDDELAQIYSDMPPNDPSARVSWEEDGSNSQNGSSVSGTHFLGGMMCGGKFVVHTEPYVHTYDSGAKVTILPWTYIGPGQQPDDSFAK